MHFHKFHSNSLGALWYFNSASLGTLSSPLPTGPLCRISCYLAGPPASCPPLAASSCIAVSSSRPRAPKCPSSSLPPALTPRFVTASLLGGPWPQHFLCRVPPTAMNLEFHSPLASLPSYVPARVHAGSIFCGLIHVWVCVFPPDLCVPVCFSPARLPRPHHVLFYLPSSHANTPLLATRSVAHCSAILHNCGAAVHCGTTNFRGKNILV